MASKFEIKISENGKYHFNLKAGNGQVILSSGLYETLDAAQTAISDTRAAAEADTNFERKTSTADEPYFVLNGPDEKMLGRSEMYSSTSAMENGIESVKKNAPDAEVVQVES